MPKNAGCHILSAFVLGLQIILTGSVDAQDSNKVRFGYPSLGFRQGHMRLRLGRRFVVNRL